MNWNDYKEHVKACSEDDRRNMEEIEAVADIVSSLIKRRQELGLSQRALAERCGIPQSSVTNPRSGYVRCGFFISLPWLLSLPGRFLAAP